MALIVRRAGDLSEAERYMQRSLALAPRRADFLANYGNLLRAANRPAEAAQRYREALALDARFRPARLGLARVLNETHQSHEAEREIRVLLAANEQDAEAWNELGIALRALRLYADSERAYRRALSINPRYGAASHNLGALLSQQKRSSAALAELDRAQALGARGPELHYNRARSLYELGRYDETESELMKAIALRPTDARVHVMLAQVRFARGDPQYAAELQRAIDAHPQELALRVTLANLYRDAGEIDRALAILSEARTCAQGYPSLQLAFATALQEAGNPSDALNVLRETQAEHESHPMLGYLLPPVLMACGHADEALYVVREARKRAPGDQILIAHHAIAARMMGDRAYGELYDYERFVKVFDLPTPTGWRSSAAFHDELAQVLIGLHGSRAHPLGQSLRNGTQTVRSLLLEENATVRAFMRALAEPIADYRAQLERSDTHPFLARNRSSHRMVGCWSVRLRRGGYHVNHVHPEGWISSAYYVQVPEDAGDADARMGWLKFGEPRYPVPGVTPERMVEPRVGRLVLFPSYMWHGTTPIVTEHPRMSIAFDLVADG